MRADLAFVHTTQNHVERFGQLAAELAPQVRVHHLVAEELLDEAYQTGEIEPELAAKVQQTMTLAAEQSGAPVVVCTCATLGAAAERTDTREQFVAMRIDRPVAERAVRTGSRLLIAAKQAESLVHTRELIEDVAEEAGADVEVDSLLVPGAWREFRAGNHERYRQLVASAVGRWAANFDVVILAQASMAPAVDALAGTGVTVFCSARIGVMHAAALAQRQLAS